MKNILMVAIGVRTAKQIPSGHLYAALMGSMNLQDYELAKDTLRAVGLVQESGFLLTWTATAAQDAKIAEIERILDAEAEKKVDTND